jgi:SAM-dependent methyltransferase
VAIDLGCGNGRETLELLRRGWEVFAVDGSPDGIARIEQSMPPADLVYAGLSLPFCDPRDFGAVWGAATSALRPNGLFVGHFFGPNDTWADTPDMTFHAREEVEAMLAEFEVVQLREEDADGQAVGGAKHWHVFHVIARKPA